MYLIYSIDKEQEIFQAIQGRQGQAPFYFTFHEKFTTLSVIPRSHEDSTLLRKTRQVFALEVGGFAPEDAQIEASAYAQAEYYTNEIAMFHAYLTLPDAQTTGKTKTEIDEILGA